MAHSHDKHGPFALISCGLNADWSVRALEAQPHPGGIKSNTRSGATFVIENEDDDLTDCWSVVRRWHSDGEVLTLSHDMPIPTQSEFDEWDGTSNDLIIEYCRGTRQQCLWWLENARGTIDGWAL